jgi:hypothetical protein
MEAEDVDAQQRGVDDGLGLARGHVPDHDERRAGGRDGTGGGQDGEEEPDEECGEMHV